MGALPIAWKKVTIASGASLSDAADIRGYRVVAIQQPADCEGTAFGAQVSRDGTNFVNLYAAIQEATGAAPVTQLWEVTKSATLAQIIQLGLGLQIWGFTHLKLRSEDGSNAPTNQAAADADIWVGLQPIEDHD